MHPINAPASLQLTDICLAGTIIAQPPPEKETLPGTFDALVADGSIGATFGAGAVPVQLNFLHDEKTMPQMSSIKTRLEVSWKQPTRNMWLQFGSREDAEAAVRSLDGKICCGVKLKASLKGSHYRKFWSAHLSHVVESIGTSPKPSRPWLSPSY